MPLTAGTRLGSYEITAAIGSGGMGEVYRAHDARLGRDVAVKVLPASVSSDRAALARFEREARAIGALNHPNVVNVFDTGHDHGITYVVMELLEGETLRTRLQGAAARPTLTPGKTPAPNGSGRAKSGGLSRKKALDLAHQVAQGLAAAHARGIVHRDLKPENIFLTTDGRVKVLDFGLARAVPEPMAHIGEAPTQVSPAASDSVPGLVLGTVGYMAPEQVRGQAVDHRADIFSFGAVLYEMLTGERAFDGESPIETMSAILKADPLESPAASVAISGPVESLLRHCLEKQPDERFQSARDLAFQLHAIAGGSLSTAAPERAVAASTGLRRFVPAALVLLSLAGGIAIGYSLHRPPGDETITLAVPLPANVQVYAGNSPARTGGLAVSRDGRQLALASQRADGGREILVRSLNASDIHELPGTGGGSHPVWSPDGKRLAFFESGRIKQIGIDGGAAQEIARVGNVRSAASWGDDDTLLFHRDYRGPLLRVAAAGGTVSTVLPALSGNQSWFSPVWLPGGRRFLIVRFAYNDTEEKDAGIHVGSLDSQETTLLIAGRISEIALGDRELFYRRGSDLVAQPFDATGVKLTGDARVLSDHVSVIGAGGPTLVYLDPPGALSEGHRITWFSRGGEVLSQIGEPGTFRDPDLSPDGRYLAVARAEENGLFSLWTYDTVRRIDTRITRATAVAPAWSHDGSTIFSGNADGVYRHQPDMLAVPQLVRSTGGPSNVNDTTPDGLEILAHVSRQDTTELVALAIDGKGAPRVIASGRVAGRQALAISPNGEWIVAHVADGGNRLYAFPYSGEGRRVAVAGTSAAYPRWRADGRELYVANSDRAMAHIMAVPVTWTAKGPDFGEPQRLFTITRPVFQNLGFDVTRDGQKFVAIVADEPDRSPLTVRVRVPRPR